MYFLTIHLSIKPKHKHMTQKSKSKPKKSETEAKSTQKLTKRMTLRFTQEQYDHLLEEAAKSGKTKTFYAQECVNGHQPAYLMTDEQAKALLSLGNARTDLIGIANVLHGQPQEVRRKYFHNTVFMNKWVNAVTSLIQRWAEIEHYFSNVKHTQQNDSNG